MRDRGSLSRVSKRPSATKAVSVTGRFVAVALVMALACSPKQSSGPEERGGSVSVQRLRNGLEVILLQKRGAPMICSSVVVKAGVMYEAPELNGASHMLEHLLFNGTKNRTQEELYDEVDFYGGYNNATTRVDHTLFQMLMPSQYIEHGLDVQADMLFNSTLPAEKLEKERGIVLEEIGKDEDDPAYEADNFFKKVFYGDSPMGMPALGSRETVSTMPREAIADYYHRYYRPDNMVALIMGEFDRTEMMSLLERYFDSGPPGGSSAEREETGRGATKPESEESDSANNALPGAETPETKTPDSGESLTASEGSRSSATGKLPWNPYEIHTTRLEAERNYFFLAWPVEGWNGDDADGNAVGAYSLLEWLLNSGPSSGLDQVLKGDSRHLAHLAGAAYTPYSRGGLFYVWAQTATDVATADLVTAVLDALKQIAGQGPGAEELNGAYVSTTTEEIYQSERIHHFSMLKAPVLASISPEQFADLLARPSPASQEEVRNAARGLLVNTPFVVCAAGPGFEEGVDRFSYSAPTFAETAAPDLAEPPELDASTAGIPLASSLKTVRREIPGGPIAIVLQNPDSRVFAVHVLLRDRAAVEPPGKEGIADMLHRLLPAGTIEKDRETLERELNSIGAQLKVTDNPYIPFDNYYFVPDFSYLRLDTIDLFYKQGLRLLAEMLMSPRLEEADIERVRKEMLAAVGKSQGSTRDTAKRLFQETLFKGTPLASPPEGLSRSIASITRDDLVAFHKEYVDPSNMILSIACNVDAESVLAELEDMFSGASSPRPARTYKIPSTEAGELTEQMGKGQSYIYMGFTLKPSQQDEAALAVMTQILSDRMAFDIREERGLAYTVGASLNMRPNGAWLTASMGTSPANIDAAKEAMRGAFRRMAGTEISQDELERTRNSMLGRHLMRTIFSMGRAYHAGLGEFFGEERQGWGLLERVKAVEPSDVERVASQYLSDQDFLVVVVE